ncbi:MAG: tol-pal system protein YbgF, partial [Azoarcus sp.]|nr:tol-pal system protein YbgF [Azoarcus sp.]
FDDAEARQQIDNLRQELASRLEITNSGQLELASQNEQLRGEIARLRGQIEVLMNEVESLKNRQRDFYVDLDTRLRRTETPGSAARSSADETAESTSDSNYDAELNTALALLKNGKAADALTALETYIVHNPSSANLPTAHFWAGNAALQVKDVAAAGKLFNVVLGRWPNDPIAPDAMLGLANGYTAMGDARNAQRTLQSLIERYPSSNAAKIAKQRLNNRR